VTKRRKTRVYHPTRTKWFQLPLSMILSNAIFHHRVAVASSPVISAHGANQSMVLSHSESLSSPALHLDSASSMSLKLILGLRPSQSKHLTFVGLSKTGFRPQRATPINTPAQASPVNQPIYSLPLLPLPVRRPQLRHVPTHPRTGQPPSPQREVLRGERHPLMVTRLIAALPG